MSHVFLRTPLAPPPRVARGEGCYLIDSDGKRYLDGSGGAVVSCLGHSDRAVTDAIKAQLETLPFAHTGFFTSGPAEELADRLAALAPGDLSRVYYLSGGSEATEAALKLARQVALERGESARRHIVARTHSYHGNTLGALAVSGNLARRVPYAPLLIETRHIPPCYAYRLREPGEDAAAYGRRAADALETEIARLGPGNVLAFMAETVVGATAGAIPPAPGYFRRIREICDRHGVLMILDEVMCGMGRTGTLFACEQEGVVPDIVTIAKGLGAGYQPIGAMLVREPLYQAIVSGSGAFQHGHTYIGHPAACAGARAVLSRLTEDGLAARVAPMGETLRAALHARFADHPHVGDIRGRGLLQALEFVADRETKAPFPAERALHKRLKRAAFENGLICYPGGGTADGTRGDHVLLAPAYIIEPAQIDELCEKLAASLDTALAA